ncbi:hypothetical protein IMG5_109000 [Ichthyophthirius multifiliis]|uniref:Uncharacterized protein n=1 Tax=Ichthyophthirius multifiliis TaxID=5932 RepID=G0QTK0_ICHMU|nr:hypothetical protein IMG5_109000 [Ichthyophthirius multifiliis]EGR31451.1 hypothetical protein IMG5_109000 [Ichthyophthirius multifiliis]|eukprot:XP_004034937.1 hypothetical protein IMG5_109000 [Ichthyophthirius multifiliis]
MKALKFLSKQIYSYQNFNKCIPVQSFSYFIEKQSNNFQIQMNTTSLITLNHSIFLQNIIMTDVFITLLKQEEEDEERQLFINGIITKLCLLSFQIN